MSGPLIELGPFEHSDVEGLIETLRDAVSEGHPLWPVLCYFEYLLAAADANAGGAA